jgi:hypothetical protein
MSWLRRIFHTCRLPQTPETRTLIGRQIWLCPACSQRWSLEWIAEVFYDTPGGADIGHYEWVKAD